MTGNMVYTRMQKVISIVGLIIFLVPNLVKAEAIEIDVNNPYGNNNSSLGSPQWQEFTTGSDIDHIDYISIIGCGTDLAYKLYKGDVSTGTLIQQADFSTDASCGDYHVYFINVNVDVDSSTMYSIQLKTNSGTGEWMHINQDKLPGNDSSVGSTTDFFIQTYEVIEPNVEDVQFYTQTNIFRGLIIFLVGIFLVLYIIRN